MIFSNFIEFQIYISTQFLSVPAQSNVALLVDELVFRSQTFQSIVGHPASIAEISVSIFTALLCLVLLTSCQHSKVHLEDNFSWWLQKLNIVARRMSQSKLAARYNLGKDGIYYFVRHLTGVVG